VDNDRVADDLQRHLKKKVGEASARVKGRKSVAVFMWSSCRNWLVPTLEIGGRRKDAPFGARGAKSQEASLLKVRDALELRGFVPEPTFRHAVF
jgi:hypothetical protein